MLSPRYDEGPPGKAAPSLEQEALEGDLSRLPSPSGDKTTDSPRSLAAKRGTCLQIPAIRPATYRHQPKGALRCPFLWISVCRGNRALLSAKTGNLYPWPSV
jgi:hypothetical protein